MDDAGMYLRFHGACAGKRRHPISRHSRRREQIGHDPKVEGSRVLYLKGKLSRQARNQETAQVAIWMPGNWVSELAFLF